MDNQLNEEAQNEVARIIGEAAICALAEGRTVSRDVLMQIILLQSDGQPNFARDVAIDLLARG